MAGKLRIVDLGWPLNPGNAYWPGDNYRPFELHTIATLEKEGVLSKAFASPEHLGTHLDAPNHFERDQASVDRIGPERLFAPGVVIDVSPAVSAMADYRVTLDDIQRHEAAHGKIPNGAVVLAYTGWSRFWGQPVRYQNKDVMNQLHFPGYSAEAAQFLVEQRQVRGLGLDTMSVDYGLARDFAVHHVLGRAGRYGLENLAHLEQLPPRGILSVRRADEDRNRQRCAGARLRRAGSRRRGWGRQGVVRRFSLPPRRSIDQHASGFVEIVREFEAFAFGAFPRCRPA